MTRNKGAKGGSGGPARQNGPVKPKDDASNNPGPQTAAQRYQPYAVPGASSVSAEAAQRLQTAIGGGVEARNALLQGNGNAGPANAPVPLLYLYPPQINPYAAYQMYQAQMAAQQAQMMALQQAMYQQGYQQHYSQMQTPPQQPVTMPSNQQRRYLGLPPLAARAKPEPEPEPETEPEAQPKPEPEVVEVIESSPAAQPNPAPEIFVLDECGPECGYGALCGQNKKKPAKASVLGGPSSEPPLASSVGLATLAGPSSAPPVKVPAALAAQIKSIAEEEKKAKRVELLCAVCLSLASEGIDLSSTVCGHIFCFECLDSVVSVEGPVGKKCPVCRASLEEKNSIHRLYLG